MQKDHLGHVSPLSMVGDKRPGRHGKSTLKRRSSWKDTIRGLTNSCEEEKEIPRVRSRAATMRLATSMPGSSSRPHAERCEHAQTLPYSEDRGALADAESEDQEDLETDFRHLREEDKPIQARVRHVYPRTLPHTSSPLPTSPSTLEQQQEQLSAAIADADSKAPGGREKGKGREGEPIGTRLTMTSRTGYFQDRVISPSMVRRGFTRIRYTGNLLTVTPHPRCVQWPSCTLGLIETQTSPPTTTSRPSWLHPISSLNSLLS